MLMKNYIIYVIMSNTWKKNCSTLKDVSNIQIIRYIILINYSGQFVFT